MSPETALLEQDSSAEVQNLDLNSDLTLDQIDSTPAIQPPAPFAALALEAITAPARDRRTTIFTELTSLRTRIVAVRKELETLEMQEYNRQEEVKHLGEWIDTCESLGTLSNIVEPYIRHSPPAHHFKARTANDEYGFTAQECLRILTAEPGISLSSAEIRGRFGKPAMPLSIISMRTNYLLKAGKIERVGEGIYKLKQNAVPVMPEPVKITRGEGRPRFPSKPTPKPKVKEQPQNALGGAPRLLQVHHAAQ